MITWNAFNTCGACGPFTINKERIQKFKETGDSKYIDQNELDCACFDPDMAYRDFKDLTGRMASDKTLCDKAFNNSKNSKYDSYDSYEYGLLQWFINVLMRKNFSYAK